MSQCFVAVFENVLFVLSVSPMDGDKSKKTKEKGTLEPTIALPTKLATLKVLLSHTLQDQKAREPPCLTVKLLCSE